jgi:hypothetical protein
MYVFLGSQDPITPFAMRSLEAQIVDVRFISNPLHGINYQPVFITIFQNHHEKHTNTAFAFTRIRVAGVRT